MSELTIIGNGLCYCSVCVPDNWTEEQITKAVNEENPAGTQSGWSISTDKTFHDGTSNPTCCDKDSNKKHVLMVC